MSSKYTFELEFKFIGASEPETKEFKSQKKAQKFAGKLNRNRIEYWVLFYLTKKDMGTSGILDSWENPEYNR